MDTKLHEQLSELYLAIQTLIFNLHLSTYYLYVMTVSRCFLDFTDAYIFLPFFKKKKEKSFYRVPGSLTFKEAFMKIALNKSHNSMYPHELSCAASAQELAI